MGANAFTSWTDLAKAMRDDLASGNFRTVKSYTLGGLINQTVSYRDLAEFLALLAFVERRASEEALPDFNGQIIAVSVGNY